MHNTGMGLLCSLVILVLLYYLHRAGLKALPAHLKHKWHTDYIFPLCFIPRTLTSLKLKQPPVLLAGSKHLEWTEKTYKNGEKLMGVDPCQHIKWAWALTWPLHFTITFPNGIYFRIGIRWDTVDDYYNLFGFYIKKIKLLNPRTYVYYRGVARMWRNENKIQK